MSLLKTTPDEYLPQRDLSGIQYTGLASVDALLGRDYWAAPTSSQLRISFSFVGPASGFDETSEEEESAIALPSWVQSLVRQALILVEQVLDIDFIEVQETATQCGVIRFAGLEGSSPDMAAYAYMPSTGPWGGDVFIFEDQFDPKDSDYLKATILHEIGHALGLKHPFESETYNPVVLSKDQDQVSLTLMSYTDIADQPDAFLLNYPETLMPLDVIALQYLYGGSKLSIGDSVYYLSSSQYDGFYTLFDAGGVDTLDARSAKQGVTLSLEPNVWSDIGFTVEVSDGSFFSDTFILVESVIENALGSRFDDVVLTNHVANRLDLGAGFDTAVWDERIASYTLSYKNSVWQVQSKNAVGDVDSVTSVELLSFNGYEIPVETTAHESFDDLPDELYQFFVVAFNASPGVTYLNQLAEAYRFGLSVKDIVNVFTTKSQFTDIYPLSLSSPQFAEKLVQNIVKDSASELVMAGAVKDVLEALNFGLSRGDVIYNVFGNLAKIPTNHSDWGGTSQLFKNEVAVAKVYSDVMSQSTTHLVTLRASLSQVTPESKVDTEEQIIQIIIDGLTKGSPTPLSQATLYESSSEELAAILDAEWTPPKLWIDPIALF